MKKSIEQLAQFYSCGALNNAPWRGTTEHYGPVYLDLESIAQQRNIRGNNPLSIVRREVAIGEPQGRIIRKELSE